MSTSFFELRMTNTWETYARGEQLLRLMVCKKCYRNKISYQTVNIKVENYSAPLQNNYKVEIVHVSP